MRFNDIIKVLPSTTYVKLRVDDTEIIKQADFYKVRSNNYGKKKVVMIVPYCISEQEAWYYGVSHAMIEIVLK